MSDQKRNQSSDNSTHTEKRQNGFINLSLLLLLIGFAVGYSGGVHHNNRLIIVALIIWSIASVCSIISKK